MEIISSARREGRQEGLQVLTLQLQRRFSSLPATITEKLDRLTADHLNDLALEIFDFKSLIELEDWLERQLVAG